MLSITSLWLPILVSAIVVFFASAIAWMVVGHHKGDQKALPNEEAIKSAIASQNLPPGMYAFPHFDNMTPEQRKECMAGKASGPLGIVHTWPADAFRRMGQNMAMSFVFYLIVSVFVAYVTLQARAAGARFWDVFQVAGAAGIMSYCFGFIPQSIWFYVPLRNTVMCVIDGIVFGLLTATVFGLLWPAV